MRGSWRGGRAPARAMEQVLMAGFAGGCLGSEDLAELVRILQADPSAFFDYVGLEPRRDRNGNIVVVAARQEEANLVLTPEALTYADGRAKVVLPENVRQSVAKLFS